MVRTRGWRDYQTLSGRRTRGRFPAAAFLAALVLAVAGLASWLGGSGPATSGAGARPAQASKAAALVGTAARVAAWGATPEFRLDPGDLERIEAVDGRAVVRLPDGHRARLTLDLALQAAAQKTLHRARPIAGAIVLLDPRDGRVLALASTSRDGASGGVALRGEFPAASLFKLVTAAAGLEAGTVTPATTIHTVGGGLRRLQKEHVVDNPRRERWAMTIEQALARSNNPVFAKLALKKVGAGRLAKTAEAFGFNQQIPFDLPVTPSRADVPTDEDPLALGRTGAGFGEVTISPLHAALLSAAIANDGRMPRPWLVESVTDDHGRQVYEGKPSVLATPVNTRTASALTEMMKDTVTRGTSRRAFRGSLVTRRFDIAGKTGSLDGENPRGHYDWFTGFAPAEKPEIVVSALLVNGSLWHIKGSGAAREALEAWARRDR
jgi:cell division protein FtsI/penicillin-binding protein 2